MTAIPFAPSSGATPPTGALALPGPMAPADHDPVAVAPVAVTAAPMLSASTSPLRLDASVRVLLVEELAEVASHIGELLREDGNVNLVETVSQGSAAMERVAVSSPDVVIIDALLQGKVSGLQLAREMRATGMDTPIVFMTVPDRPITLNAEVGIAEVVTMPVDVERLRSAIVRVDDAHRGPAMIPSSGVVAVFSGKGGVGRTTIAHNVVVALNQRPATRAVLVDGDLAHGDLRLHLGAPDDAPSLLQLPTGHVTDIDVVPLLWRDPSGVDNLLAPPRLEQADLILRRDVENALVILQHMYDVVVIDVPAVMDDMTLAMLDTADVVLDVVTTERGAIRKARRCHEVLSAAGFAMEKMVTVVNRADAPGVAPQALVAELGRQPEGSLPHEHRLAIGELAEGSSILKVDPSAPVSLALAGLAELLATRVRCSAGAMEARSA